MDLTKFDYDMLLEAIEAWKSKDLAGEMAGMLFSEMMTRGMPELERREFEEKQEREEQDRKADAQRRNERAICIAAKLIALRDRELVNEVCNRG